MLLSFAAAVILFVMMTGVAQAAVKVPTEDVNDTVLKQATQILDAKGHGRERDILLTTVAGSDSVQVQSAVSAGNIVVGVGKNRDLLAKIPQAWGGFVEVKSVKKAVSFFALQPGGYFVTGTVAVKGYTPEEVAAAVEEVEATVSEDLEKVDLAEAVVAVSGTQVLAASPAPYMRTIAHVYPYGETGAYARPYGIARPGLKIQMEWYDGNNSYDYWLVTSLDEIKPGYYLWGNSWANDKFNIKWMANSRSVDLLQQWPETTEAGETWSADVSFPGGVGVSYSQTMYEVFVGNMSSLSGYPNTCYHTYQFLKPKGNYARFPYNPIWGFKTANTQNAAMQLYGSMSYQVNDGGFYGYFSTKKTALSASGMIVNVRNPGY